MSILIKAVTNAFPTIKSTYKVGYLAAYHPPSVPFVLPSPVLTATNEPVLKVDEVGWALFYPAQVDDNVKGDGVDWIVRSVAQDGDSGVRVHRRTN